MPSPLQSWHDAAVSALAYGICGKHLLPGAPETEPPYNDIARFLFEQWRRMPDYLRPAMQAATLLFDAGGVFRAGNFLHHCAAATRRNVLEAAKSSGFGFERDLLRYYESLAALALYSRREGSPRSGRTMTQPPPAAEPGAAPVTAFAPPPDRMRYDVAVIGSGPGGAITACLLAEAGKNVVLLEEGPWLPLHSCEPFSLQEMRQKYRNGGQTVAFGRSKVAYVEGCCVGGGSEINSGLYHRTPADVLDRWHREYGVVECSETELQPHFEACERDLSVAPLPGAAPEASLRLDAGARKLGWKSIEVPRWFRYHGQGAGAGTRQSMTETYIPRFIRAGGRLLADSRALELHKENDGVRIEALHLGKRRIEIRTGAVFLCGGAVQTPALLHRSGIERHVGNSLRLHPTVKVLAGFSEPVNSADMGVPVHQVKEFAPRLSFGCSVSTPAYLALAAIDYPEAAALVRTRWPCMANYYAMTSAEGRGNVSTLPFFRDPLVRYRLSEFDRGALAEGVQKLCALLFEAGATALYPSVPGQPVLKERDHVSRLPAVLPEAISSLMTIHLFSSCPMGEDQGKCATDSFGRLHQYPGIYINDASLLCTPPGVNPQGTIMAFARRNTLRFLGVA